MGNMFKKNSGTVQANPQQGGMSPPYQQQPGMQRPPQPGMQQQPMMQQQQPMMQQQQPMMQQQQPMMQQQPRFAPQQPQYAPQQPQYAPQQPQYAPQQAGQYRPPGAQQQQPYRPSYPSGPFMPRYSVPPPLSLTSSPHQSTYENDAFLSNLTGWSNEDIERLRHEYLSYANMNGVIDRDGFRKLYIASLLNETWEAVERDAEAAFRNFDINQTGVLDFNEYITACSRMTREVNQSYN
jgi:hypothetical protein